MPRQPGKSSRQSDMFRPTSLPQPPEGYYSGDQPNPNLRAFVEAHLRESPYDPASDDYAVETFTTSRTIENRRDPINDLHIYWSKKPYKAIQDYIRHYTRPGDLVLDPFCGSGGTALAALMEGRKAVAIDRSPAATFITRHYCTPVDAVALQAAFESLEQTLKPQIDSLYATRCDRCGGAAMTTYTVYSQVFQCPRCLEKVALFDCVEVEGRTGKGDNDPNKTIAACPYCFHRGITEIISTRSKPFGAIPVMVSYQCQSGCKPIRSERRHNDSDPRKRDYFQRFDLARLDDIDKKKIPYWIPATPMIKGFETTVKRNLEAQGVSLVSDLFTRRNLCAMSTLLEYIDKADSCGDTLRFAFSGALWNATKMYRHRELGGGPQAGTYYLAQIFREIHAWTLFEQKVSNLIRSAGLTANLPQRLPVCISTQSATDLAAIPSTSVDYIFTDPPYAAKVQYGELNFVWEAWLGFDTSWHDEEIIVNSVRGKTEADWAAMMRQVMAECYRVLKPGRAISLCYHDTSEGTWALVQDLMAEAGFLVEQTSGALFIDTGQKSYNQLTADKVNKRDLVINFRKPRPGEAAHALLISGDEDSASFGEKVRTIIRAYLADHPGSSKDRIYDEVVSRMVRAGRMEAHNFDELLAQVAEAVREPVMANLFEPRQPDLFGAHEMVRWYLKETALAVEDAAESAREAAAAKQVRGFVERKLAAEPAAQGIHYSDIFEHYVYSVKEKPRRALADWLLDYFYKTDAGTYRPPISEEEEQLKAQARAAGTNRRIRRYVAYLQQGLAVPQRERPGNADLAGWIRQCKRNGLYEYGRLLYERGGLDLDQLSEEQQVEVDEDYQTCMRMLARAAASPPELKSRGRRKAGAQQDKLDL